MISCSTCFCVENKKKKEKTKTHPNKKFLPISMVGTTNRVLIWFTLESHLYFKMYRRSCRTIVRLIRCISHSYEINELLIRIFLSLKYWRSTILNISLIVFCCDQYKTAANNKQISKIFHEIDEGQLFHFPQVCRIS